jgi:hypothetical protein
MTAEYRGSISPSKRREEYELEIEPNFEEKTPRKLAPISLSSKLSRKDQRRGESDINIVAKQFKIEKVPNVSSVPGGI